MDPGVEPKCRKLRRAGEEPGRQALGLLSRRREGWPGATNAHVTKGRKGQQFAAARGVGE